MRRSSASSIPTRQPTPSAHSFESGELLARLRAIQRRATLGSEEPFFRAGPLEIDFNARTVAVKGREVKLTATEYALLKILAQHAGKVITHKQLLREVWGPNAEEQLNICAFI
jgi:two-component system, OmpR family, KDP operon response regulator KdpE